MRREMVVALTRQETPGEPALRPVRASDDGAMARLMLAAYRGTTDDEGESIDDAVREVASLRDGVYGRFLPECSRVADEGGWLASATLVTIHEGSPLLAFSMTDPRRKRAGLARAGVRACMNALMDEGHDRLRLFVTPGNAPAERLYESLGFRDA